MAPQGQGGTEPQPREAVLGRMSCSLQAAPLCTLGGRGHVQSPQEPASPLGVLDSAPEPPWEVQGVPRMPSACSQDYPMEGLAVLPQCLEIVPNLGVAGPGPGKQHPLLAQPSLRESGGLGRVCVQGPWGPGPFSLRP